MAISDPEDVITPVVMGEAVLADISIFSGDPLEQPLRIPPAQQVPQDFPMVTAIGDSVMLGAAPWLARSLPNIDLDSEVGRQASTAIALLRERQERGQLGQIVLVHIGNNGTLAASQFDQIMRILGSERQVIFLNTQVPRAYQEDNNAVLSAGAARYANVTLIDWRAITEDHPELFGRDRTHLNVMGAEFYTALVIDALLG